VPDTVINSTAAAQKGSLAQEISRTVANFEEASVYELVAAMGVDDPHAASEILLEHRGDPAFPMLKAVVLANLDLRIGAATAMRDRLLAVKGDDAPGGPNDRAREAAFRRDPGSFLPGAVASIVKAGLPLAFWNVLHDGQLVPCAYVCRAAAMSDLHDMICLLDEQPHRGRGIVIGAPETERDLAGMIPDNVTFVSVDLAGGRA
jgi:hypothetical protein